MFCLKNKHKLDYYDFAFVRSNTFVIFFVKLYCNCFVNGILFDKEKFESKSKILHNFIHENNNEILENELQCLCAVYEFVEKNCYSFGKKNLTIIT